MKVIVNTGPLVVLSKIDRLPILQKFGSIFAPKGVISEIKHKKDDVSKAVSKISNDWLKIKTVTRSRRKLIKSNYFLSESILPFSSEF